MTVRISAPNVEAWGILDRRDVTGTNALGAGS